jgi:hypothetical protein
MEVYDGPGVYIVTLTNEHPISVNADRPKIADRCIKVTKDHCKFGKARNLKARKNDYFKTFGEQFVRFHQIAAVEEAEAVERLVKERLVNYRIRGLTGRMNEWLEEISPQDVELVILECLSASKADYRILGNVSL